MFNEKPLEPLTEVREKYQELAQRLAVLEIQQRKFKHRLESDRNLTINLFCLLAVVFSLAFAFSFPTYQYNPALNRENECLNC